MVANSPGLIAGSNVLHPLLMPRHPPCALHSLSQQRQNNTRTLMRTTKEHTTHPPIKEMSSYKHRRHTDANTSTPPITLSQPPTTPTPTCERPSRLQRCSRPLCRSQTTTPPTTEAHQRRTPDKGRTRRLSKADPSGPNSVLDPIPHQREATGTETPHQPTHPKGQADDTTSVDDSTSEHHHRPQTSHDHVAS